MAFRRYGGDLDRSGVYISGRFTGLAFWSCFLGGAYAYHVGSFLLLFLSILLPIPLLIYGYLRPGKSDVSFQEKRFAFHLEAAQSHIDAGQKDAAIESLRKAKIYGALPDVLQAYWLQHSAHR